MASPLWVNLGSNQTTIMREDVYGISRDGRGGKTSIALGRSISGVWFESENMYDIHAGIWHPHLLQRDTQFLCYTKQTCPSLMPSRSHDWLRIQTFSVCLPAIIPRSREAKSQTLAQVITRLKPQISMPLFQRNSWLAVPDLIVYFCSEAEVSSLLVMLVMSGAFCITKFGLRPLTE